ncbi:MAG: tRNA (cytidine(56)-2'-O)-methyltransferase [Nitrososphaeraceae archaeon]
MTVSILRIGHRLVRDDRTTTHVALVARAFGCSDMYMTDTDDSIKLKLEDVSKRWGYSSFKLHLIDNWKHMLKNWKKDHGDKGKVVHLTMYGININNIISEIQQSIDHILIIIGAEKVPKEIFMLSDYNISISNQPHSEISALSVFLDRFFQGRQLELKFNSAKMKIIPSSNTKIVTRIE